MMQFPYNETVNARYGAPMGRANIGLNDEPKLLNLRRVPLHDGYDNGGAYWGYPANLWCAFTPDRETVYWFRAASLHAAIASVQDQFPDAAIRQITHH